jgi:hypothetical protein
MMTRLAPAFRHSSATAAMMGGLVVSPVLGRTMPVRFGLMKTTSPGFTMLDIPAPPVAKEMAWRVMRARSSTFS